MIVEVVLNSVSFIDDWIRAEQIHITIRSNVCVSDSKRTLDFEMWPVVKVMAMSAVNKWTLLIPNVFTTKYEKQDLTTNSNSLKVNMQPQIRYNSFWAIVNDCLGQCSFPLDNWITIYVMCSFCRKFLSLF